jgi:hypothetical protein
MAAHLENEARALALAAAATRIQAVARGNTARNIVTFCLHLAKHAGTGTHLPTPAQPAPLSPTREARAAAILVSPDSVAAHPACPPTAAVEYTSAIRLQAFTRMLLAQRAVARMTTTATDCLRFFAMSAHEGYDSEGEVSDEWEVSEWMTTAETFNDLGFTFHGGPTEAQQEQAAMPAQVHTGLNAWKTWRTLNQRLSPRALGIIHKQFTTAAAILLRFARHRCLPSQHRGDTIRTIKAKQLIKQLTTGLKGERERVSDQLAMAIQAEQAAQNEEETGVWEYTPCYLVKYVNGVETHLPTCAKTGCNMHRYSPPHSKHFHRGPGKPPLRESLFCSPECKEQVCASTGLQINELRWVHDDYHRRADDLTPSERAQHYRLVERAGGANPGL